MQVLVAADGSLGLLLVAGSWFRLRGAAHHSLLAPLCKVLRCADEYRQFLGLGARAEAGQRGGRPRWSSSWCCVSPQHMYPTALARMAVGLLGKHCKRSLHRTSCSTPVCFGAGGRRLIGERARAMGGSLCRVSKGPCALHAHHTEATHPCPSFALPGLRCAA